MTLEYFPDTDTLYIALRPTPSADAAEVAPNVMFDYDAAGDVIGVTIEHASKRTDLSSISLSQIPALAPAA